MNRRFAEAVIAVFREADRGTHVRQFARLGVRDWRRGSHWLDASGLALYCRHRVASSCLEECVPAEILNALDQRLEDNKQRIVELFRKFEAINNAFQKRGVRYANLKGFTLIPDYCPDPSLRCQFDRDFIIFYSELGLCQSILEGFWIRRHRETHGNVVEFKAGSRQVPSISDVDMFLAQADHLLRHLKSEWTRISCLVEFRTFVNARTADTKFWQDVRNQTATNAEDALPVGVAVSLATQAFGNFGPPELLGWSIEAVPKSMRLWLNRYGKTVLWSDFPRIKLYLLLDGESSNGGNVRKIIVGTLLPCTVHLGLLIPTGADRSALSSRRYGSHSSGCGATSLKAHAM